MKRCLRCNRIGFWFQFYRVDMSLYTWTPDFCRRCAGEVARPAIEAEIRQYMQIQPQPPSVEKVSA
jgi:hypothetical protein